MRGVALCGVVAILVLACSCGRPAPLLSPLYPLWALTNAGACMEPRSNRVVSVRQFSLASNYADVETYSWHGKNSGYSCFLYVFYV